MSLFGALFTFAAAIPVAAEVLSGVGVGTSGVYSSFVFNFTEYIGECTGTSDYGRFSGVKLWSPTSLLGTSVPEPQNGRRVRIINRSNAGAYTDREWQKPINRYLTQAESEPFAMGVTNGHDGAHLGLKVGENNLIAVFYQGGFERENFKELATTEFTVTAKSEKGTKTVNRQLSNPVIECAANPELTSSSITDSTCPGERQQVQYLGCPAGTTSQLPRERRVIATLPGPGSRRSGSAGSSNYRGAGIYFHNRCRYPVQLAVRYQTISGDWMTGGWWSFSGDESAFLAEDGENFRTNNPIAYYYAEIVRGRHEGVNWKGDNYRTFRGRSLPMRKVTLSEDGNRYSFSIHCDDI
ncbi:DUF1036 domain-containing protein [Cyanobacteria bacterium FACHB-63]|nr:DUF1036 domain-containing protein [Cyanobacteria bacterium FACHB-63]